jgi:hypothetical protein
MGLLSRMFGTDSERDRQPTRRPLPPELDAYALERYRYMLQTAPTETIEQAHVEAFRRLTPEQRRQVLHELARAAPANDRASLERATTEDPRALARLATHAEVQQPGIMERTLGAGTGSGFGAGLLCSFAAGFAGSRVASSFFSALGGFGEREFSDDDFPDHGLVASAAADDDEDFDGIGGLDDSEPDSDEGASGGKLDA